MGTASPHLTQVDGGLGLLPGRASQSCDPRGTQDGLQSPQTQALMGHPRAEPGHPRGFRPPHPGPPTQGVFLSAPGAGRVGGALRTA